MLGSLFFWFAVISILSVGGVNAVMPEMQRLAVEVNGWVSEREFVQLFAVAQAAPGPNVLIVGLIGYEVAGLAGAFVALAGMCGPAGVAAWYAGVAWDRFRDSPLRDMVRRALAPLTIGLVVAGGFVLATPADADWRTWAIAAAAAVWMAATKVNPLWILAAGGAAGALFLR